MTRVTADEYEHGGAEGEDDVNVDASSADEGRATYLLIAAWLGLSFIVFLAIESPSWWWFLPAVVLGFSSVWQARRAYGPDSPATAVFYLGVFVALALGIPRSHRHDTPAFEAADQPGGRESTTPAVTTDPRLDDVERWLAEMNIKYDLHLSPSDRISPSDPFHIDRVPVTRPTVNPFLPPPFTTPGDSPSILPTLDNPNLDIPPKPAPDPSLAPGRN